MVVYTPPRYGASSHPTSFLLPTTQRSTSEFINRELTLPRLLTLTYCPDSEVRIIVRHPRLRTSELKDTSNLLI